MKTFWKTYLTDYDYIRFKAIVMVVCVLLWMLITREAPWFFMLGYILVDPVTYYTMIYRKPNHIVIPSNVPPVISKK